MDYSTNLGYPAGLHTQLSEGWISVKSILKLWYQLLSALWHVLHQDYIQQSSHLTALAIHACTSVCCIVTQKLVLISFIVYDLHILFRNPLTDCSLSFCNLYLDLTSPRKNKDHSASCITIPIVIIMISHSLTSQLHLFKLPVLKLGWNNTELYR